MFWINLGLAIALVVGIAGQAWRIAWPVARPIALLALQVAGVLVATTNGPAARPTAGPKGPRELKAKPPSSWGS